MEYQEFPKSMVHPNYRPAQVQRPSIGKPLLPGEQPQEARAAFSPPVSVVNKDQEEAHRALGYIVAGEPNPDAYAPQIPPAYVAQEYPKWVNGVEVSSREEEDALTGKAPTTRRKAPAA